MATVIHAAPKGTITKLSGNYTDGSAYLTWLQNGVSTIKALFDAESDERWSAAVDATTDVGDGMVTLHTSSKEPDLVVWERDGDLVYGPKVLSDQVISADCTLQADLSSGGFRIVFAEDGGFINSRLTDLFGSEKSVGLEMGYGDDLIRIATSQAESDDIQRMTSGSTYTVETKNKLYDLLQLPISKTYGKTHTIGELTEMIHQYSLYTGRIIWGTDYTGQVDGFYHGTLPVKGSLGSTIEVRIDSPLGTRWTPGSVEIRNVTEGVGYSAVYGQTELFAFVRIWNETDSELTPHFDVWAHDITSLARRVGGGTTVADEEVALSGNIPVRLAHKSIDGSLVTQVTVTGGGYSYTNGTDYLLAIDGDGYTTIARGEDSAIEDGTTVYVDYTYINAFSFSLHFGQDQATAEWQYNLATLSEPTSYQVVITAVSWYDMSPEDFTAYTNPLCIAYYSAVNTVGVQIALLNKQRNVPLDITFEIWARPMETVQPFGVYPTLAEVIGDLAKSATYKDKKLYEGTGELTAGRFTSLDPLDGSDICILLEEGFDPNTLRIENTGSDDVNITIVESGYIIDNDGLYKWGARLVITRASYTGAKVSYSYQIWGQYTNRKDYVPYQAIDIADLPQTTLTQPLKIRDITLEEAARKVLQICFCDGAPYRFSIGSRGEWQVKLHKAGRVDSVAHTFSGRNMAQISRKRKTPYVIDRVQVDGSMTASYLVAAVMEQAHSQSSQIKVGSGHNRVDATINFNKVFDPSSYELRNVWSDHARVSIISRQPTKVVVMVINNHRWNAKSAKCTFEIWGKPTDSVQYQEQYVYKTNSNASGRYTYAEAKVDNELITDPVIAGMVSDQVIIESCQDQLVLESGYCPFNPALEVMDTCLVDYAPAGDAVKTLVEEITYAFDCSGGAGELTMDVKLVPRLPFAAGFAPDSYTFDGDDGLDSAFELGDERDDSIELCNLIFG